VVSLTLVLLGLSTTAAIIGDLLKGYGKDFIEIWSMINGHMNFSITSLNT